MIIDPDFLDHWRTGMVVDALGDSMAPMYIMRLWAHCQERKSDIFAMPTRGLKAQCKFPGDAEAFELALSEAGFIARDGETITVCGWAEKNASLIAAWENGAKGGRPPKRSENPSKTHGIPSDNPAVTQAEPTANPSLTQTEPIREDKSREEENTPQTPGGVVRKPKPDPDAEPAGFAEWYAFYPRKDAKRDAIKAWRDLNPDTSLQLVMQAAARNWPKNPDPTKIPLPATWLRGARWNDACVARFATQAVLADAAWWIAAGFPNVFEAENNRCWAHNSHLFRDGKRLEVAA